MEENYIFTAKQRMVFIALMVIGVLMVITVWFRGGVTMDRLWSVILVNNLFFLYIALFGAVFLSLHRIALSGWHTSFQRIPEAMTSFLPWAALLMFLIYFGMDHLYHWPHPDASDTILLGKTAYLNIPFFFVRMGIYFLGWMSLVYLMRKNSRTQDLSSDIKYHRREKIYGALFMVFFAVTISTSSWDWLMSIDAHWFSTLFGWYVFIGLFVLGISALILILYFLSTVGYLKYLNKEHIHDLGKYLFGFSIFWAYLWFSQYLLIWYSHLPEETIYFQVRLQDFKILFFVNLIMNFVVPFLALMTRNSKRNIKWLCFVALLVFMGHWLDIFLMVVPGTIGESAFIGLFEIGVSLVYLAFFMWVIFYSLSRVSLITKNDPYLQESFHYHN